MKVITCFFIFLFSLSSLSLAQQPPSPEKMREETEKMQKQMEKQREAYLEMLKQQDPTAYEKIKQSQLLSEKISKVISYFQQKSISREEAERQLFPLVKESLQDRLKTIDSEMERLKERISYLEKVKRDPSIMVEEQIEQLLGGGPAIRPPELY